MVVIFVNNDFLKEFRGWIKASDVEEAEKLIVEKVLSDEPVVSVYPHAYKRYSNVIRKIEANGGNPYLYDPISLNHIKNMSEDLACFYIKLKERVLYSSKPWMVPFKVSSRKLVTRRALLRSPIEALRRYIPAPLLVDPFRCESLINCNMCTASCPKDALIGKPPQVDLDKCEGCGLCAWSCPFDLLTIPSWPLSKVETLLKEFSSIYRNGFKLLFVKRNVVDKIEDVLDSIKFPVALEIVDSLAWIGEKVLLSALKYNADIIIYYEDINKTEEKFLNTLKNLVRQGLALKLADTHDLLAKYISTETKRTEVPERLETSNPVYGIVKIDTSKCTLCDACSNKCPTGAIVKVIGKDEVSLIFRHERCNACGICEDICPQSAITVEYVVNNRIFNKPLTLVVDRLARCIKCGKPLGPESMISYIERKLLESGIPEGIVRKVRLCENCKKEELF